MQLIYGNLFDPKTYRHSDGTRATPRVSAIAFTSNGFVKRTGDGVMGRGCAKALAEMDPRMPLYLGKAIKENGNIVQVLGTLLGTYRIVTFPVKPSGAICAPGKTNVVKHMQHRMTEGKWVPGWACVADMKIIIRSARQLVQLAKEEEWADIVLPRPGCGAGQLNWSDVKPILDEILDDSFYSITYGGSK
jgi:hypothetical protein